MDMAYDSFTKRYKETLHVAICSFQLIESCELHVRMLVLGSLCELKKYCKAIWVSGCHLIRDRDTE